MQIFRALQKTAEQFLKDRHKFVGGVTDTRYILSEVCTTHQKPLEAKYHVPSIFFEKAGENEINVLNR